MDNRQDTLNNFAKLKKTWPLFFDTVSPLCWWGNVPFIHISRHLAKRNVAVGAIVLATLNRSVTVDIDGITLFGGVLCCGMYKRSKFSFKLFTISLRKGSFYCVELKLRSSKSPMSLLKGIRSIVTHLSGRRAYFLAKPQDSELENPPDMHLEFSGSQILDELHTMRQSLGDGWWGLSCTSRGAMLKVVRDLEKKRTDECSNPGAAISFTQDDSRGYLFTVVTSHVDFYQVSFHESGYALMKSKESPIAFPTMLSVLDFLRNIEKIKFVARSFQTLKEICRDVLIKNNLESNPQIPASLKAYLNESPYAREYGVRTTKFIPVEIPSIPYFEFGLPRLQDPII